MYLSFHDSKSITGIYLDLFICFFCCICSIYWDAFLYRYIIFLK